MIASICDRCGAVVEASGDDAPLAFYAQVMGEDAVAMDDLFDAVASLTGSN